MSPTTKTPLLEKGTVLNGKWEILEHIATGGKGEVYCARQTNLDREVVVKTISAEYLAEFGDDQEEVQTEIQRFHREALAMAQIRHPYVLQIYDQDATTAVKNGEEVTVQYVVMEYVPGARTLRDTMPDKGFRGRERDLRHWIKTYFLPMFDGLETVHALGIVHRDMKPENVLLDGSTPKITDFGIAGGPQWAQLTRSHHVEGTITYMAPEQFMDLGDTDARADVYALGKMLYEAAEGRMVDSKTACPLKGVCLANPNTPFLKGLDLIVQLATAEDLEKRTPSVKALQGALERLLAKAEESEKPLLRGLQRRQVIAIAAVLVGVVVGTNLYHHFIMEHEAEVTSQASAPEISQPTVAQKASSPERVAPKQGQLAPTLGGKDGSTMHLVPAGRIKFPAYVGAEGARPVDVPAFYMDETEVTNYKYVEFLNQVLPRLEIKNQVVLGDGRPWLLLEAVYGGYEPIVFRKGRFLLQDASGASRPVVKVTAYGAEAYAAFYGKSLQTEVEWLRAASRPGQPSPKRRDNAGSVIRGTDNLEKEMEAWAGAFQQGSGMGDISRMGPPSTLPPDEESTDVTENQGPSNVPYPVLAFNPDVDGIRGLTRNVSEWGTRAALSRTAKPQFVVLGGVRGTMIQGSTPFPGIAQDPTMAFEDVGFRCAKPVNKKGK